MPRRFDRWRRLLASLVVVFGLLLGAAAAHQHNTESARAADSCAVCAVTKHSPAIVGALAPSPVAPEALAAPILPPVVLREGNAPTPTGRAPPAAPDLRTV